MEELREGLNSVTSGEHELYREVVEAANYASEHPGIHYGGMFETTELFLHDEDEIMDRLENSLETSEQIKEALEQDIERLRFDLEKYAEEEGEKPEDYHVFEDELNDAEQTLEQMQKELQHIQEMKENTPEENADGEYVEDKETEAATLADRIEYTPKREERA